jgi:hypothetical protein
MYTWPSSLPRVYSPQALRYSSTREVVYSTGTVNTAQSTGKELYSTCDLFRGCLQVRITYLPQLVLLTTRTLGLPMAHGSYATIMCHGRLASTLLALLTVFYHLSSSPTRGSPSTGFRAPQRLTGKRMSGLQIGALLLGLIRSNCGPESLAS